LFFVAPSPSQSPCFTPTFDQATRVVHNANLIVGMHPDQAVDAIVDAALAKNVSFFVVPCCVYSKEFPNRRVVVVEPEAEADEKVEMEPEVESSISSSSISNGENGALLPPTKTKTKTKLVTTYDDLIRYLMAKSPEIRKHTLPFEGRNICLYRVVS